MFNLGYVTLTVTMVATAVAASLFTYTLILLRDREASDPYSKKVNHLFGRTLPNGLVSSYRVREILYGTLAKENLVINIDLFESGDFVRARFDVSFVMRNLSDMPQIYSFVSLREGKEGGINQMRIDGTNQIRIDGREMSLGGTDDREGYARRDYEIAPKAFVSVNQTFTLSREMPFLYELVQSSLVLGGMRVQLRTQIRRELVLHVAGRPQSQRILTTEEEPQRLIEVVIEDVLLPGDTLLVGAGVNAT